MKKWLKSEICGSHEQYTGALFTEDLVNNCGWKKEKKKKKWKMQKEGNVDAQTRYPNIYLFC